MDTYVASLELPISRTRLAGFRPAGGDDLDMVVNDLWNVDLCQAMYPALHGCEVSLRNTIHAAASAHDGSPFWFDQADVLLPAQHHMLRKARRKLTSNRNGHSADDIVAALTMGFWASLFNRPFEYPAPPAPASRLAWHDSHSHASPLLLAAFPHAPRRFHSRNALSGHINRILWLRNRVFHHEPIWNRADLRREHQKLLQTIGWISPGMQHTIALCDRFPEVLNDGRVVAEAKIRTRFETIEK